MIPILCVYVCVVCGLHCIYLVQMCAFALDDFSAFNWSSANVAPVIYVEEKRK